MHFLGQKKSRDTHPQHSWQEPSPLRGLRFVSTSVHAPSCPISPPCIDSSILVPVSATHNPNTFSAKLMLLHFGRLFSSYRVLPGCFCPKLFSLCLESTRSHLLSITLSLAFSNVCCFFLFSPRRPSLSHQKKNVICPHLPSLCLEFSRSHFGPSHFPCIFMFLLLLPHHTPIFACCRTPLCSMLHCFHFSVHKDTLFCWLCSERFAIFAFFHQTVDACCILQCCINLLPFLLNRDGPHLRHLSAIQHRSLFC